MLRSVYSGKNSLFAPLAKLLTALKQRGVGGVLRQLYVIGDLKFGTLKGEDRFGNKYYENVELPYGQHRWVEYANIHDPDPTMIQPEWHGWMHHMYDHTPNEKPFGVGVTNFAQLSDETNSIFGHNVGKTVSVLQTAQHNTSQYRQRGYKVGNLMVGPEDKDNYYLQPGHPLSPSAEKGGRFKGQKREDEWVPPESV